MLVVTTILDLRASPGAGARGADQPSGRYKAPTEFLLGRHKVDMLEARSFTSTIPGPSLHKKVWNNYTCSFSVLGGDFIEPRQFEITAYLPSL